MSQIKCNVGNATIRIATGHGDSDSASFDYKTNSDGTQGWPVPYWPAKDYTLHVNDRDVVPGYGSVSVYVPQPANGQYDDIVIDLPRAPMPVSRLHADGWDIVTEHGQRYVSNGISDFSLLQVLLELDRMPTDADLDAHLNDGYQGFNEHRVFGLMSVIPSQRGRKALKPENYPRFWPVVEWLTDAMIRRGKLVEWTTGDRVPMALDDGYLKRYFGQLFEIQKSRPNLIEGVNEIEHSNNAVDPTRVLTDVPSDIFFCCGSSLSGGGCPHFARDNYSNFHDSRDEKKTYQDANPIEQIIGWAGFPGLRHPIRVNEFPGAQANADLWKRYSDPKIARRLAGIVKPWAGGTFHVQHGIFSEPLDDVERACAAAWHEGIR